MPEEARDRRAPTDFEVWHINWPAWQLFCRVSTQWRIAGMHGQRLGLDYTAAAVVLETEGVRSSHRRRELLRDLQTIEAGALTGLAERANHNG